MLTSDHVRLLLDSFPDTVLICDSDGYIRTCNSQCEELLGYSAIELVGLPVETLLPEELRQAHIGYRLAYMMSPRRRPMFQLQEIRALRKDGKLQPVSIALSPLATGDETMTIVTIRDSSAALAARNKEKEMFERLLQKQRLENLGLLSSGIAHDFRNLLSVVLGNAELGLLTLGGADTPVRTFLEAIRGASGRLHDLSNHVLRYASGRDAQPRHIDLNAVIREMVVMLERALAPETHLALELAEEQPSLVLDPSHIFQLLLNLILNANDAIGARAGRITIRTGADGEYVFIQVEDDGRGMDPATREQILEPFYTTKDGGKGLGLSVVNAIVQRYKGSIRVDSELGQGAAFTLLFPLAASDA